jgi:predicted phage-related endonuclease
MTAANATRRMLTPNAYAHDIATEPGSPEWLDLRRQAIGGSDVPAILGDDRYSDQWKLYLTKKADPYIAACEATEPFSEPRHFGNLLEPVVVAEAVRRITETTGRPYRIGRLPLLVDANCPYRIANLDAVLYDPDAPADAMPVALVEAKTTGLHNAPAWRDGPPINVVEQVTHYLMVTGLPVAYVACLIAGQRLHWYEVHPDPGLMDTIAVAEAEFWQRIIDNDPPAPTGLAATGRIVTDLHPTAVAGLTVDLSMPDDADMIGEFRNATVAAGLARERLNAVTNRLKLRMADADTATMAGQTVATYRSHPVTRLDGTALKKTQPEVWERYAVTTHERRLKVS